MKLKSLYLKNFRTYQNINIDFDEDLNIIIGKNDIGKSTILEALDIFFGQETIKIDIKDYNINASQNGEIIIGAKFKIDDNFELIIDATNKTTLKNEYLLKNNKCLEIYKKWVVNKDKLLKEKIYLKANYPQCFKIPLVNLKINALRSELEKIKNEIENYDIIDKTKSAEIRKALYKYYIDNKNTNFSLTDIDLQKEEGKNIWSSLKKELPLYFLFQSDRENKDSDGDIQNPLKSATKQAISELENDLEKLKETVETKLKEIGNETINKMQDMDLEIAKDLKPVVRNKSWDSLFSFTLESDNGIPLNKRGSGFRRMVLLNYFRAEAERKANQKNNKNIIYAIEEPETSQHPNHQKLLINSLIKLSKKDNYQIFLTTHTPEIAKMANKEQLIYIEKNSNKTSIITDEIKFEKISKTLGILPFYKNKVVVCVEGELDINFLRNINNKIEDFKKIIDLEQIDIIPLNGSNLKYWVQRNYLKNSNIIEIHIYDSDKKSVKSTPQYERHCKNINTRNDKNYCFLTNKREMENYIHWSLIEEEFDIKFSDNLIKNWDYEDIPKIINNKINNKMEDKNIKQILNNKLSQQMTKNLLEELNAFEEIKGWFSKIKELSK